MLAVVVALPAAVRGPEYLLDDWFLLANAHFDGWWRASSHDLFLARPGSGVVYAVVFGLIGRHPLAAYVLQVALVGMAAVALRSLLNRFMSPLCALAVAALWLVIPNHGSLIHWATASAITVALVLLLVGLRIVDDGRVVSGALVLGASVLCYEATAPAAAVGMVAISLVRRRRWLTAAAAGAAVLLPAVMWVVFFRPPVKKGLAQSADLTLLVPAHIGWGVFPDGVVAVAGGTAAAAGVTMVLWEAIRRRRLGEEAAMVLGGITAIVVGTVPFIRYFYAPLGAGDRVNVVAGVGTALVWVGLLAWLARRAPNIVAGPTIAGVVIAMGVAAWQGSMAWADAGDDARRVLRSLPELLEGVEVVVVRPPIRRNVGAFADRSNITGAVQLEAGTRDVSARLVPPVPQDAPRREAGSQTSTRSMTTKSMPARQRARVA